MPRTFLRAAVELIKQHPGLTHDEYARMALERGLATSGAIHPQSSLATTLAKRVREGRLPGVYRTRDQGEYRYFPGSNDGGRQGPPPSGVTEIGRDDGETMITILIMRDVAETADRLVGTGKSSTRAEAVSWMTAQWLEQNADFKSRLESAATEIDRIRATI